jgi:hypothetical protein
LGAAGRVGVEKEIKTPEPGKTTAMGNFLLQSHKKSKSFSGLF